MQRKRSHVVDDLIGLVDAIAHATENDRAIIQPAPAPMPLADMPEQVAALFARPVVAIHPGAGNITKQWPTGHFSALIDLLIEKHDVNILLIGGPDEVDIADTLLARGLYPGRMASMAGRTGLADLPRLLNELRPVYRQRQRTQAHRQRHRNRHHRHPFRRRRSCRMGTHRRECRGAAAEHGLQPVLSGERR